MPEEQNGPGGTKAAERPVRLSGEANDGTQGAGKLALLSLVIPAVVSLAGGGLAGSYCTAQFNAQRMEQTGLRVVNSLRVDLDRLDETVAHNARIVEPIDEDRPRAFVRYPTQTYEIVLFGGQFEAFANPEMTEALVAYLHQAYHANEMINLFEQFEAQAPEPGSSLWEKRREYLLSINHNSTNDMPLVPGNEGLIGRRGRSL